MKKELKIFTGTANHPLSEEVANYVNVPLGLGKIRRFSDGEISVNIEESVRGDDVFVIQPLCYPVNDHLIELLIYIDALKRASAKRINAVIPYYGYARQDRKMRARDPITAKLVADLLTTAGADRVICMDLHAGQIQGFFNIPVDHLTSMPILARYFKQKNIQNGVIVSPDLGGVTRARGLGERLKMPLAIIDKRRPEPNVAEVMNVIGDVKGKKAILVDDLVDTAGTITMGAEELLRRGAVAVYACCTHPVLSGPAKERISNSPFKEVVVTNTIPLNNSLKLGQITVLSVASLIGDAIKSVYNELSVSKLFD
ncbi:MAG: ribose-phosphate pyrophosphokinase [Firmicutes bacterium]|nr:ribose-phosphate pyrophosphokinase [Bacillota bacterium]